MKKPGYKQDRIGTGFTRRDFLKTTTAGGAALLLPVGLMSRSAYAASPSLAKFKDPLPIPKPLQPGASPVTVAMRQIKQEIHSDIGPVTIVWAYGNDQVGFSTPGPTFVVNNTDTVRVTWHNRLAAAKDAPHFLRRDATALEPNVMHSTDNRKAVVHLHGGHITAFADGFPEDYLLPTESVTYDYSPQPRAATLWYHDHAIGNTRLNVYMGLAGAYIVRDALENAWIASGQLPSPDYEMPLVLQDRRLTKKGQLTYHNSFDDTFFGDVMLVNGKAWPHLEVERRKYRFRVLNGSNTRNYTLQLGDGSLSFQQIGSDGGFLAAPLTLTQLTLTPGERADIIIDFAQPGLSNGDDIVLMNHHVMAGMKDEWPIHEVMQFRVRGDIVAGDVMLPVTLASITPLDTSNARSRQFKLEDVYDPNVQDAKWLINGGGFEAPPEVVPNGAVEIWNWVNKSDMIHPMHIHLVQAQVLGRWKAAENEDGKMVPVGPNLIDENEKGWKDTVRVGPLEIVRVAAKFDGVADPSTLPGREEVFPFHCHVLEHEDHDMMRRFTLQY